MDKAARIKDLIENKAKYIALKKAEIKLVKGGISGIISMKINANKAATNQVDESFEIKRTVIGNTYMWMDGHEDVHAKAVFSKSIKEKGTDIFHLHDHEYKIVAQVGDPQKVYEGPIKWKDLGVDKSGETEALFMDSNIRKDYNERMFNDYKAGKIQQHSVGMNYVKIALAVDDEDYDEENKLFKSLIDQIGNKQAVIDKGYFWYIKEAKLIEISAVLRGSNELTGTLEPKADNVDDDYNSKLAGFEVWLKSS